MSLQTTLPRVGLLLAILAASAVAAPGAEPPAEFVLKNGLKVRLVPIEGPKTLFVILGVRAGIFEEPADRPHLAHVTEHAVVFGLTKGTPEDQALTRWFPQGRANGETLADLMYFDLQVEPGELATALRVQAARLARPGDDPAVLDRERPRTLAELRNVESSPRFGTAKFAWSAFVQAALHGRTEAFLKARTHELTLDDVRRFHARTFRPDRAELLVIGGFDPKEARTLVADAFGSIAPGAEVKPAARPVPKPGDRTCHWDCKTRHLILGWPTPPGSTPEHAALTLAAETLALRVQADAKLASQLEGPFQAVTNEVEGLFLVNLQARSGANLDTLATQVRELVGQLAQGDAIDDRAIRLARPSVLGLLRPAKLPALFSALAGSSLTSRANQELQLMSRGLVWGDPEAYARRVDALGKAEVRAAVSTWLDPRKSVVVRIEPEGGRAR